LPELEEHVRSVPDDPVPLEETLQELDNVLRDLNSVRARVSACANDLRRRSNAHRPVSRLPAELLMHIFRLAAQHATPWLDSRVISHLFVPEMADASAMTRLARVCHPWRRIILATPSCWNTLRHRDIARGHAVLHPLLTRSGEVPLTVCVPGIPSGPFGTVLEAILQETSARVRHLWLGDSEDIRFIPLCSLRGSLETLHLDLRSGLGHLPFFNLADCSRLRTLSLTEIDPRLNIQPEVLAGLTRLVLELPTQPTRVLKVSTEDLVSLIAIIRHTRSLLELAVGFGERSFDMSQFNPGMYAESVRRFGLKPERGRPRLQKVVIKGDYACAGLFIGYLGTSPYSIVLVERHHRRPKWYELNFRMRFLQMRTSVTLDLPCKPVRAVLTEDTAPVWTLMARRLHVQLFSAHPGLAIEFTIQEQRPETYLDFVYATLAAVNWRALTQLEVSAPESTRQLVSDVIERQVPPELNDDSEDDDSEYDPDFEVSLLQPVHCCANVPHLVFADVF
jgi:hypothetical protein